MSHFRPNEIHREYRIVGNREPFGFLLTDNDDDPIDLTGLTLVARWVNVDTGDVKVDDAACTIVDAEDGEGQYSPAADDVDEAGTFAMYVVDTTSAPNRRWPPDARKWLVRIDPE